MTSRIAIYSSILSFAIAGGAAADMAKDKADKAVTKPAAELTKMADALAGTWTCTGKSWTPDGTEHEMRGTVKSRLDLDRFWIHDTLELKVADAQKAAGSMIPTAFKSESFTTFDIKDREWHRVSVDSIGCHMIGKAEASNDKVLEWKSDSDGPMGEMSLKEHFDMSDPKILKVSGQRSMDRGRTWQNDYEATCKKG